MCALRLSILIRCDRNGYLHIGHERGANWGNGFRMGKERVGMLCAGSIMNIKCDGFI